MDALELVEARRRHLARLANQRGAEGEVAAIVSMEHWIPRPRGTALKMLMGLLNEEGIAIRGSSFDAIAQPNHLPIDFTNAAKVREILPSLIFIEIKTANQRRVKPGFSGFFFALTAAEIEASKALGLRHRVALYNKITGELLLTSVPEILARASSSNWQLSVQL